MKFLKFFLGWMSLLALVGGASVAFAAPDVTTLVAGAITAGLGIIGLVVAAKP